jgi:molybdopterin synthase sulfur carrier subunit
MIITLSLFGIYRDFEASGQIKLEVDDNAAVADVRLALLAYAQSNWPEFPSGLAAKSAFASQTLLLRDGDRLPSDGLMAVLPPVSGG